jgi:hypothetical protein
LVLFGLVWVGECVMMLWLESVMLSDNVFLFWSQNGWDIEINNKNKFYYQNEKINLSSLCLSIKLINNSIVIRYNSITDMIVIITCCVIMW